MQDEKKQQKIFAVGFSLIVVVILGFLLKPLISNWRNHAQNSDEQKANAEILKAPSITADDLFQEIRRNSKIFLVDISSNDDFKRGHIATAANVPEEKLDKNFFKNIGADSTANIIAINQGDDLATLATRVNKIVAEGFVNAKYLRGGIADWKNQGYPIVSSGASDIDGAKVKKITIEEIKNEAGINPTLLQFLDVRSKGSFAAGHIVGAINIPLAELERRKNEAPAAKKIIIYGADENESFQAAVILFDLNFFNVWQMQGTLEGWKAADGKTE